MINGRPAVKVDHMTDIDVRPRPGRCVADLMSSPVVSAAADDTLAEAARAMVLAGVGSVVIADEAGLPMGILTERDLVRATEAGALPGTELVASWMTATPDVAGPHTTVDGAFEDASFDDAAIEAQLD